MNQFKVFKLTSSEWQVYKEIRLEALQLESESFGESIEEALKKSTQEWQKIFETADIFIATDEQTIVGMIGLDRKVQVRFSHNASFFGLYINQKYRSQGIANHLLLTIIEYAKQHNILQLYCRVNTNNNSAVELYKKHGFQIFGTDDKAMKINDIFYDQYLMKLKLI